MAAKNNFGEKSPVDHADTLGVKNLDKIALSHCFRDKCVFTFYAEIQDGGQKWRKIDFWEKSPVYSPHTLGVKNFYEIAQSRTVSEIFTLFYFPDIING